MTHQKTKFSYRLTEECIETEWKSPSKRWMIVLKWLTVITAIAVLFVIALNPSAFWIALAGPGGMGLLYLGLANSKQFQDMPSLFRHNVFTWNEIEHIYIDKSRHLISLEYEWLNENFNKTLPWWTYIFCYKKDFEITAETIISKNTSTHHTREKVEAIQTGRTEELILPQPSPKTWQPYRAAFALPPKPDTQTGEAPCWQIETLEFKV